MHRGYQPASANVNYLWNITKISVATILDYKF